MLKNNKINEKLQVFAGAMMTPIILLVIVGFFVPIGAAFTDYIFPEGSIIGGIFSMYTSIGFLIMRLLPVWFAVGIAFTLAKNEKGWAAMSGLLMFFAFIAGIGNFASILGINADTVKVDYLVENLNYTKDDAILYNGMWTEIAGIFTLNMGIFGGIICGIITSLIHNRWYKKELPNMFSFFGGAKFVVIMVAVFSVPISIMAFYIWPFIGAGIRHIAQFITSSGLFGTFVFGTVDKMLLPFGLHHLLAFPIEYSSVGGVMEVAGQTYEGVRNIMAGQAGSEEATGYIVRNFTTGRIIIRMASLSGIALAMYKTSKPENRKKVASIVLPAAITAAFVGITEPLEYTFVFCAPALYFLVYCPLAGLTYVLAEATNVSIIGHALFFMIPNLFQPQKVHALSFLYLMPAFFFANFFAFKWAIVKFNFLTPGRSDDNKVSLIGKKEYKAIKNESSNADLHQGILDALGGPENIENLTYCATRLRVQLEDETKVLQDDDSWKAELGAIGVVRNGKSIQIIYGTKVNIIGSNIKDLMNASTVKN
ncbi:MAG: PTS transporter subunit EIIC [Spirochaetales bacterium]|nr:PTS transporter subunit EIIC [Spirochaetales bacterium]